MSSQKSFLKDFFENIQKDMSKSKEMKESLKKFREEAEKLEKSDALKKAREKYETIESETTKSSQVLKEGIDVLQEKLKQTVGEVEKTEIGKKGKQIAEELGKTASKAAETVSQTGEQIGKSHIFQSVSQGVKTVKQEIDEATLSRARIYKAPDKLRKREDQSSLTSDKPIEADTEATGVVMHKDSKWNQSWQNFKDNNQYVHKLFDLKEKYEESDHLFVRATRTFTDKVSELFGGMFSKTEMSEVLTEICKMDPTFDKEEFIQDCQSDIIPNVLEAIVRGDLEIIKDWCHEAAFNVLATPIKQAQAAGYKLHSKVLDVNHVDIVAGKMMDQGPVLVISFNAQQIMVVRNSQGSVVEGDPEKIMRIFYVWALCRDQSILDPKAAWRIVDLSSSPSEQFI